MGVVKIIFILIVNVFICNALAYLVSMQELIKFKPFNCYGCLSFWFTFLMGCFWVHLFGHGLPFYGVAFLSGILNFLYVKSKYKIHE